MVKLNARGSPDALVRLTFWTSTSMSSWPFAHDPLLSPKNFRLSNVTDAEVAPCMGTRTT